VKFRNRTLVDRVIATPVAFALNVVARLLGLVLRPDHAADPSGTRSLEPDAVRSDLRPVEHGLAPL
jgi:hypothetical protein